VSCYHRYVVTDDRPVTLAEMECALQEVDPTFAIDGEILGLGEKEYGLIDITFPGDPICDGDLELLARLARTKRNRDIILACLWDAKCLVTVTPLSEEGSVLQPLWDWLLANRAGVLAFEGPR
jgi:hypothetical protein